MVWNSYFFLEASLVRDHPLKDKFLGLFSNFLQSDRLVKEIDLVVNGLLTWNFKW